MRFSRWPGTSSSARFAHSARRATRRDSEDCTDRAVDIEIWLALLLAMLAPCTWRTSSSEACWQISPSVADFLRRSHGRRRCAGAFNVYTCGVEHGFGHGGPSPPLDSAPTVSWFFGVAGGYHVGRLGGLPWQEREQRTKRCTEWRPRHAAWQFVRHGGAAIGELNR